MTTLDFSTVTERSGAPATPGQIADAYARYAWASEQCRGRRVLEVGCGTGQGLGLLLGTAHSVIACDIEPKNVEQAQRIWGERVTLRVAPAEQLPAADSSVDVVLLFEALYYLERPELFLRECTRVLARDGVVLLTTTNKDLFDFVRSPFSHRYFGASELPALLSSNGFTCELFGASRTAALPLRHRVARPIKSFAGRLGLLPKTMRGKAVLRRLVFGRLPVMPIDLASVHAQWSPPARILATKPDDQHRFLYVVAQKMTEK